MMRWAVEMRTRRPSEKAFTKAFNEGKIVRLHLLRGTWQLVSAEDYWWMLDLCATKAKQVINGWMSSNKIAIHDEELSCIRNLIVETIEKEHVSKTKIKLIKFRKNGVKGVLKDQESPSDEEMESYRQYAYYLGFTEVVIR